jgi:hypothetical protein
VNDPPERWPRPLQAKGSRSWGKRTYFDRRAFGGPPAIEAFTAIADSPTQR